MRLEVGAERPIAAPPDQIAAFAFDPANDTAWIGGIKRVRVLTDAPFGIGTRVERTASFLGRRFDYVLEVAEYEPGRRVVHKSIEAPFPMTVRYDIAPQGTGTLARVTVAGDPGRAYKIGGRLMDAAVRRNLARDLRRLEALTT